MFYNDSSSYDSWDSSSDSDDSDFYSDEADQYEHDYDYGNYNGESSRSRSRHENTSSDRQDGAALSNMLWPPDKTTLKVRFRNGSQWDKDTVEKIVKTHYHAVPMRIRFKFLKDGERGPSDIRIEFASHSECTIGQAANNHPGETTMWLELHPKLRTSEERQAQRQSNILHEFGHALGMMHEHTHPDCKANWNYRVLQAKTGWSMQRVHNNYRKLNYGEATLSQYDPESIMHYPINPGDTQSMVTRLPLNTVLSEGDKRFLMAIYPADHTSRPRSERKTTSRTSTTEPGKKREKKRESTSRKQPKPTSTSTSTSVKKPNHLTPTVISSVGNTTVNGGYVIAKGVGNVTVMGGGYVEQRGSGNMWVHGDSDVKLTGAGNVWVYGSGNAVVTGVGNVFFSGKGKGKVTGAGNVHSNGGF